MKETQLVTAIWRWMVSRAWKKALYKVDKVREQVLY